MHFSAVIFVTVLLCVVNIKCTKPSPVVFKLYKRDDPTKITVLQKDSTPSYFSENFDTQLPTRIYIHGWLAKNETIEGFREALLNAGDVNLIIVDWTQISSSLKYFTVKKKSNDVDKHVTELIDALVTNGMNLKSLTLIAHGLGAHICGRSCKGLKSKEKVGAIIGLDPATIRVSSKSSENRLDKSDADYVEIIHTDFKSYGLADPIGHVDFYPNKGLTKQPGCSEVPIFRFADTCSHTRANDLFLESLSTNFTAVQCASYAEIKKKQCTFDGVITTMGGDITSTTAKPHGVYYLETEKKSPFVISDYKSFKNMKFVPKSSDIDNELIENKTIDVQESKYAQNKLNDQHEQEKTQINVQLNESTSENETNVVKNDQERHEEDRNERDVQKDSQQNNNSRDEFVEENNQNEHGFQEDSFSNSNSKSPVAVEDYNSFGNINEITNNGTTKGNGHDEPIEAKDHEEINKPEKETEEKEEIDPNERNEMKKIHEIYSNENGEEKKQDVVNNGDIKRGASVNNSSDGEENSQDSKTVLIDGNEQYKLNEENKSSDQNDQSPEKDQNKSNERFDDSEEKIQDEENEKERISDQNEALHGDVENKPVEYTETQGSAETNGTNDHNITNIQSENEESIESVDPFELIVQEKEIIPDEQSASKDEDAIEFDDFETIEYEDKNQNKSTESELDYGYEQNDQNNQTELNEQNIQEEQNDVGENKEQREDHGEENIESSPTSNFFSMVVSSIMKFIHILITCIYLLRDFFSNLFFA